MAQKVVDISKYINNDAPQMVLFGKTYTVKNDKKTVLALNDLQLKAEVNGENADEKIIELLVGKEEAKEICKIINESANYSENAKVIMLNLLALATGQRSDFRKPSSNTEVWYDLMEDYPLIEASFLEQYGLRLSEVDMSWREFSDLLSCLSADTALGRVVAIRSETDGEVLKNFTKGQKEIREEWLKNHRKEQTEAEYDASMQALLAMALA